MVSCGNTLRHGARKRKSMNSDRARRLFLRATSALMLLCAPPMFLWCFSVLHTAQTHYSGFGFPSPQPEYAAFGCLTAAITYAFSMATAIAGLVFANKPHRYKWCRVLASIQLGAGLLLIVPLEGFALLILPPLLILTVLLLFCVGWREKRRGGYGYGEEGGEKEK